MSAHNHPIFLVFGATGTVGRQVAGALLRRGAQIRVAAREAARAQDLAALGAEIVEADLEAPESLPRAFEGVTGVALITPFVPHQVDLVRNAVAAAKAAGVEILVRMSGTGADPSAPLMVARTHGEAEAVIEASGLPHVIVRPTFFQDNLITFMAVGIKAEGAWSGAAGGGATAYVSAEDIGEVIAALLLNPSDWLGARLELTGPEAHTDAEIARWISEIAGYAVQYLDLPPDELRQGMLDSGAPEWMADDMVGLEQVKAAGWASAVSPDVSRVLGRPAKAMRDHLRDRGAAFRR